MGQGTDEATPREFPGARERLQTPMLRLCNRFSGMALGAALVLAICVGLNARSILRLPDVRPGAAGAAAGEAAQGMARLGHLGIALNWLGLLLLAGAACYGFRIARQARLDALHNEKIFQDATKRTLEIATLYDTTQDVSGRHELTPLLQNILERAMRLIHGDGAAIFLYDAKHDDFQIAVEKGVGMPIGAHLPLDEGLSGEVAKTLAPVIANDYANWPNRSRRLRELPIRATVCVPMIRGGELIGVLGVHEVRSGEAAEAGGGRTFTEADAKLLSLFAGTAASAVNNARLLEELRRSEERFRIAAESVSDLVYERDLVADTARFFRARHESRWAEVRQLAGTLEEFHASIHPEDRERVWAALQKHLREGAPYSEEYRICVDEGAGATVMSVSDRAIAIRDHEGKPVRLVGSTSDITARKRDEQLRADFASFVTHQLRTPLSGVKWMLELAMDAKDTPEEMQSFVQDARLSTDRLINLVNDLLDVSRLEGGRLKVARQPVDLGVLTREAVAELNPQLTEMGHTLHLSVAPGVPSLDVDPQLLRQAVANLLSNAVKYTPAGGVIDVGVTTVAAEAGAAPVAVRWEVRDTGIGIPRRDLGKLFQKFYRADNVQAVETEGTGLGLYLVRLIVEQFGGKAWCESTEGAGSTFAFTIPASADAAPALEAQAAETTTGKTQGNL
ncbi:MAG: GAF domain-containing protein [Acidobacteriota bacterium]|jgi:signal transduction histidine kinase|nr:GAF domain-containing protein [Acidobacteriota bacterium]